MTIEVMQDYCTLLFIAGLDTVINGIGCGIRHLAQDHAAAGTTTRQPE